MSDFLTVKTLNVPDREAWRAWLEQHHASEADGIWLVYYKKHTRKACVEYGASVEEALCFGWVDNQVRRLDEDRFLRRFVPRKEHSKWSESNRIRAAKLIETGRMAEAGLAAIARAKRQGLWAED